MNPFRLIARLLRTLFGHRRLPPSDEDPYAGVREPRRHGPRGRESAVALMEPESAPQVDALR